MKPLIRFRGGQICIVGALAIASAAFAQDSKEKPKGNAKHPDAKSDGKPSDAKPDEGRAQLLKAYDLTRIAKSAKEFSEIIELGEKGIAATDVPALKTYGQKLVAWAYYKRGDAQAGESPPKDKEALADFDAAVKQLVDFRSGERPDWEYQLLHSRGTSYAATGQYEKALADFNEVIRMRPNYGKEYYNRGEMQAAQGQYEKAIADYDLALRFNYGEPVVYTARGFANFQKGDVDSAIADYSRAIARNRGDYEAFTLRGDAFTASGRHADAIRDYQQAINLNGKYARVFYSAAWLRATCPVQQFRNAESALRNAQAAIELGGDGARNLRVLAAAQARFGQFGEAIATANKALEKAKGDKDEEDLLKRMLEGFQAKKAYESEASSGAKAPEKAAPEKAPEKSPEKQKKQP